MSLPAGSSLNPARRRALALLVNSSIAVLGGALATLLGLFARPAGGAHARWVRAAALTDLTPDTPVPRILAVPRVDGWYRARVKAIVFLVWDGAREVRAFSATCTHLGCQVIWDPAGRKFLCPCHGGAYGADGRVIEGPPPRPLKTVAAQIDSTSRTVLVRL